MNTKSHTIDTSSAESIDEIKRLSGGFGFNYKLLIKIPLVLWFVLAGLALLMVTNKEQGLSTIEFMWSNVVNILPFIIGSAILAGYLEAANVDQLIGRVFNQRVWIAIVFAAVFGAFSPFCSCGVIPLIAALMVSGVPLSAIMAFWISSPVMDPAMFLVTSGGISVEFAVIKSVSAMGLGLFAGSTTQLLMMQGWFQSPSKLTQLSGCAAKSSQFSQPVWRIWTDSQRLQSLKNKTVTMVLFLLKWLVFAYFLESIMLTYVSADSLANLLTGNSVFTVIGAALLGVPAYLNGFAAVPLVAGLIDSGLSQGAALSFMLAGSITSIPAGIAVYSLVRKSIFAWYLILALSGSILAGLVVNISSFSGF